MNWYQRTPDIQNDEGHIRGFFDEYRWASNFYACPVMWKGLTFKSSEAAYHAAKSLDPNDWVRFTHLDAGRSKKEGRRLELREDWEDVKLSIMYDIVLDKFLRNPELAEKLIATGDKHLEETNWWGDTYWGVCKGVGENHLGEILMQVREKLNTEEYILLWKNFKT